MIWIVLAVVFVVALLALVAAAASFIATSNYDEFYDQ